MWCLVFTGWAVLEFLFYRIASFRFHYVACACLLLKWNRQTASQPAIREANEPNYKLHVHTLTFDNGPNDEIHQHIEMFARVCYVAFQSYSSSIPTTSELIEFSFISLQRLFLISVCRSFSSFFGRNVLLLLFTLFSLCRFGYFELHQCNKYCDLRYPQHVEVHFHLECNFPYTSRSIRLTNE